MEFAIYSDDLKGLARQCPECKIVAHYDVKGRKEVVVKCKDCGFEFAVQKYHKYQRPQPSKLKSNTYTLKGR